MTTLEDSKYWVAWNLVPGIGRVRLTFLKERFGTLAQAWGASISDLKAAGLDARSVSAFATMRDHISPEAEMEKMRLANVQAITPEDPTYPDRLKEIYDPPAVLYVRGSILPEDAWSITVVGTRRPSAYGREVTARLVKDLSRNKIAVVSGLARGIDAVAHQTALDSGARTVAVQACGLDMVYPAAHTGLARRISESGAVITAKFAAEEGREVMAVPGSILSPQAKGCNRLIQDGAKAVLDVEDILEEVNVHAAPKQRQMELPGLVQVSGEEALILKHLSSEPAHVDAVRRSAGLPISVVSSTLAMLELKGLARQVGGMSYIVLGEAGIDYAPPAP